MRYYISIEKNAEGFECFKTLWNECGIDGIMAATMTEGIARAIEVEKSRADELYFIDIVADDIDYLPQLRVLNEETAAPILIATSSYTEEEHHAALNNGADFYGGYCDTPEQNIHAVITVINNIDRRARKQKPQSKVRIFGDLLISPLQRAVFVGTERIDLTRKEFDLLYYLTLNHGRVLSHKQIYRRIWGGEYEDAGREVLRNAVKRLRDKLKVNPNGTEYIQTMRDFGYRFPT